ncbi:hypothetical protein AAMO2058_000571100, partial [Amorphochlora amoebiformis]
SERRVVMRQKAAHYLGCMAREDIMLRQWNRRRNRIRGKQRKAMAREDALSRMRARLRLEFQRACMRAEDGAGASRRACRKARRLRRRNAAVRIQAWVKIQSLWKGYRVRTRLVKLREQALRGDIGDESEDDFDYGGVEEDFLPLRPVDLDEILKNMDMDFVRDSTPSSPTKVCDDGTPYTDPEPFDTDDQEILPPYEISSIERDFERVIATDPSEDKSLVKRIKNAVQNPSEGKSAMKEAKNAVQDTLSSSSKARVPEAVIEPCSIDSNTRLPPLTLGGNGSTNRVLNPESEQPEKDKTTAYHTRLVNLAKEWGLKDLNAAEAMLKKQKRWKHLKDKKIRGRSARRIHSLQTTNKKKVRKPQRRPPSHPSFRRRVRSVNGVGLGSRRLLGGSGGRLRLSGGRHHHLPTTINRNTWIEEGD